MAVVGLILGIFGLCFFPLGLTALVLGIIALAKIDNPQRPMSGRGMAISAIVLGAASVVVVPLLIGILLPALGAARRAARQMENTTQVRGITQGMFTYATINRDFYPGLNRQGIQTT